MNHKMSKNQELLLKNLSQPCILFQVSQVTFFDSTHILQKNDHDTSLKAKFYLHVFMIKGIFLFLV